MRDRNPKPDYRESEVPRRHPRNNREESQREKALRGLYFLALTLAMVLAGALLLETVASSLGVERLEGAGAMAPGVDPGWGQLFLAYRFAISVFVLLFAYHCFVWRVWARTGLLTVLVLDLTVWLAVCAHTFYTTANFGLDLQRMALQVLVVCFEVGLLRLLLDDDIIKEFHQTDDRVPRLKNERTN